MECSVPFSLLEPHHCELTGNTFNNEPSSSSKPISSTASATTAAATSSSTGPTPISQKRQRKENDKKKEREKRARREAAIPPPPVDDEVMSNVKEEDNSDVTKATTNGTTTAEPTAMESQASNTEINPENVIVLKGHTSEVFSCAWNPVVSSLLASGSGDATARLWQVPETQDEVSQPYLLQHLPNLNDNKDVTTLDWNVSLLFILIYNVTSQTNFLLNNTIALWKSISYWFI